MAKKQEKKLDFEAVRQMSAKERLQSFSKARAANKKDYRVVDPNVAEERVPYGFLTLDDVCGLGGMPRRGRVIEIHGNEHSGKSTLTYGIVSAYQRFTGEPAVIFDFERTGDWNYLHKIGVDDSACELIMPDCIQDAEKRTLEFMESGVRLFVFDSIVRMREEVERKIVMDVANSHKSTPGEHARAMERFFNNMLTPAARYDCVFLMVNQPRARIEATREAMSAQKYPSFTNLPYILPGGKTCRFTPSVMIETMTHKAIRAGSAEDDFLLEPGTGDDSKQDFAATKVKIRILKNKTNAGGYREGSMYLRKGIGFDDNVTIRELAREYGLIANSGKKWYVGKSVEEAITGYPDKEAAIEDLVIKQNPEVLAQLRVLVKEAVRNDDSGRHLMEVDEHTERYMAGVDDDVEIPANAKRQAFEIEEDIA